MNVMLYVLKWRGHVVVVYQYEIYGEAKEYSDAIERESKRSLHNSYAHTGIDRWILHIID